MNDAHHVENVHTSGNTKGLHSISRFYAENPQWWLGPDPKSMLNWAVPEVRDHMFALIAEQCRGYDLDGFEMDFLRHPSFFRLNETTPEQYETTAHLAYACGADDVSLFNFAYYR